MSLLSRSLWIVGISGLILVIWWWVGLKPSHEREWALGQEQLPSFEIDGNKLRVNHFRNFTWTSEETADRRYDTANFDLEQLSDLDVFISHFGNFEGLAHIFLSFGFTDGERLVISLEARREDNEAFSPVAGLGRQYELIYVVGGERDLVGSRLSVRGERLYRYPTVASPKTARALLLKIGEDINTLAATPRFYHTLFANCTNTLTQHVTTVTGIHFPPTIKSYLPGYFDEVLYALRLIGTTETFSVTKMKARIDPSTLDITDPDFSRALRQATPDTR